jgi:hypothetical protein
VGIAISRACRACVGSPAVKLRPLVLGAVLLVACGDDDTADREPAGREATAEREATAQREAASPAPPADAGTRAGHGADPGRVAVPERDPSPPTATIALARAGGGILAEASQPPEGATPDAVTLDEPALRGIATGRDPNGGVARVRVSIREEIECRDDDGPYSRLRTRYFPPPQVERIRSNPGARLPTKATRSIPLRLSQSRCGTGRVTPVRGELWGEAVNGSGLEAVTPHLKFVYEAD